jgi:ectoine hydroxylase-related dioxygenase (phytanoyl-CoA dioxygenase family)
MNFWYKAPRNPKRIPWHQDVTYWPMDPPINLTAWISLGYSLEENGCLRIIPGTHKELVKHNPLDMKDEAFLKTEIDASFIDESKAIDIELTPGQAVFFTEKVFHGSEPNTSNIPRVALAMRFTTPEVKINWDPDKFPHYRTFLLHGEDKYHYNDHLIGVPPVD